MAPEWKSLPGWRISLDLIGLPEPLYSIPQYASIWKLEPQINLGRRRLDKQSTIPDQDLI